MIINQAIARRWEEYPIFPGQFIANGLGRTIELQNNINFFLCGIEVEIVNRFGHKEPDWNSSRMYIRKLSSRGFYHFYEVHPWQVRCSKTN